MKYISRRWEEIQFPQMARIFSRLAQIYSHKNLYHILKFSSRADIQQVIVAFPGDSSLEREKFGA